ncbi:MAG: hypothetical protein HYT93_00820 [Parcubacteria group bacterium]|nr:hypothetical protein [Parcubacteria group bacterium]
MGPKGVSITIGANTPIDNTTLRLIDFSKKILHRGLKMKNYWFPVIIVGFIVCVSSLLVLEIRWAAELSKTDENTLLLMLVTLCGLSMMTIGIIGTSHTKGKIQKPCDHCDCHDKKEGAE